MALQPMITVGFILLSVWIAGLTTRRRLLGHLGWQMASAVVALGGMLANWLTPDWAGWSTATLFVLLVAAPLECLARASGAAQRGQWKKAARFHSWAALLHPTPWTRFGAALARTRSTDGPAGYTAALQKIEATGSRKQKTLARLLLAHDQRDWDRLLMLSRAADIALAEVKPREIRALGELGRLEEMVQTYRAAAKWLLPPIRRECMLFVLAFTGGVERVQQLLDGPLSAIGDESKTYWLAVVRVRRDPNDNAGRSMLRELSAGSIQDGVARSAARHLRQASEGRNVSLSLSDDAQRAVAAIGAAEGSRLHELRQWNKRTRRARVIAALCLTLLAVVWAVLQAHYGW